VYRKSIVKAVSHLTATMSLPHLPQGASSPSPAKQVAEAAKSAWSATQKLAAAGASILGVLGLGVLTLKANGPVQPPENEELNPDGRERREAFLDARRRREQQNEESNPTSPTSSTRPISKEPIRISDELKKLNEQSNTKNMNNQEGNSNLASTIRQQQEQEALKMGGAQLLSRYRNRLAPTERVREKVVRTLIEQAEHNVAEQGNTVDVKIAAAKALLKNPNAQALLTEVSFPKSRNQISYKFSVDEGEDIEYNITLGNIKDYNSVRSMYSHYERSSQGRIENEVGCCPIPFELQEDFTHTLSGSGMQAPEKFEREK
jgi:hypothetical protein